MTELVPGYTPPETFPDFNDLRGRAPGGIRDAGVTRELWIAKEAYNIGHYEHFRQHRELFRRHATPTPTRPRLFAAPPVRTYSPNGEGMMVDAVANDGTAWWMVISSDPRVDGAASHWTQLTPLPPATDTP